MFINSGNARLMYLGAAILAAAAIIMWNQITVPVAATSLPPGETTWQLPALADSDAKKNLASIVERNLWGNVIAPVVAPPADPAWRFIGVMRNGNERYLMISIEGRPITTLKPGDELPGGSRIISIEDDHLCLLVEGKKRKIGIYRQ